MFIEPSANAPKLARIKCYTTKYFYLFLLYGNRWMGLTVLAGRLIILEVEKKKTENAEPGSVYFHKSPILGSLSCCSTRTYNTNSACLNENPNNILTLSCVFAGTFSPVSAAFLLERNIQLQSIGIHSAGSPCNAVNTTTCTHDGTHPNGAKHHQRNSR